MRNNGWLQKILYVMMAVLGAYILFKGGGLLAARNQMRKAQNNGGVQQSLEDSAMRTWALGYTATVEGKKSSGWLSWWMSQVVPVLSYRADTVENEDESLDENYADNSASDTECLNERDTANVTDGVDSSETASGTETANVADNLETAETSSESEDSRETEKTDDAQVLSDTEVLASETEVLFDQDESTDVDMPNETVVTETEDSAMAVETETTENSVAAMETEATENSAETMEAEETENSAVMMETDEPETGMESERLEIEESEETIETAVRSIFSQALPQLSDFSYLVSNYYTVDSDTMADAALLNAAELLSVDLTLEQDSSVPQILIYHTHSQEAFADSVEGEVSDTVVGMGEVLADELRGYGYNVIHDTGVYDLVDGVLDRSAAYDYARASIEAILEEYPTIEVVIDLHRDGVEGSEEDFVTEIDGESTSRIMFFNGLSRDANGETLSWLPNSYLKENLAFSLQLQVLANTEYPGFTRKIYLQAERYNLHLRARSLLIEAGTQLNTVEEEQNAMAPIAKLIWQILS